MEASVGSHTAQVHERSVNAAIFEQFLPVAEIVPINFADLPENFQQRVCLELGINGRGDPQKLLHYLCAITYINGDTSYAAHQVRSHNNSKYRAPEIWERTDIYEYDRNNEFIGNSHVVLPLSGENLNLGLGWGPRVSWTYSSIQRAGYGLRRYFMMNALYMATHGQPLSSEKDLTNESVISLWNKLVKERLAERITFGRSYRYCFKPDALLQALKLDPKLPLKRL